MNVSLTPELERLVNDKVKTGMYQTASEVVREGLRLLKDRDQELRRLRADIRTGLSAVGGTDYDQRTTKRLAAEIKSRGRTRLAASRKRTAVG